VYFEKSRDHVSYRNLSKDRLLSVGTAEYSHDLRKKKPCPKRREMKHTLPEKEKPPMQ
jgi:hypothetical protein